MTDAKLIMKPPHMSVRVKPGVMPDLPRMLRTIKQSGFEPIHERVELRLSGRVVRRVGVLMMEFEGVRPPTLIRLVVPPGSVTMSELEARIGQLADVEGFWSPAGVGERDGTASLAVAQIHPGLSSRQER